MRTTFGLKQLTSQQRNCRTVRRRRLQVERLEDRRLLATLTWDPTGDAPFRWHDANNWDDGTTPMEDRHHVPGGADTALFSYFTTRTPDLGGGVVVGTLKAQGSLTLESATVSADVVDVPYGLSLNNVDLTIKSVLSVIGGGLSAQESTISVKTVQADDGNIELKDTTFNVAEDMTLSHASYFSAEGGTVSVKTLLADASSANFADSALTAKEIDWKTGYLLFRGNSSVPKLVAETISGTDLYLYFTNSDVMINKQVDVQGHSLVIEGGNVQLANGSIDLNYTRIDGGNHAFEKIELVTETSTKLEGRVRLSLISGKFEAEKLDVFDGSDVSLIDSSSQLGSVFVTEGSTLLLEKGDHKIQGTLRVDGEFIGRDLTLRANELETSLSSLVELSDALAAINSVEAINLRLQRTTLSTTSVFAAFSADMTDQSRWYNTGAFIVIGLLEGDDATLKLDQSSTVVIGPSADPQNDLTTSGVHVLQDGRLDIYSAIRTPQIHLSKSGGQDSVPGTLVPHDSATVIGDVINEGRILAAVLDEEGAYSSPSGTLFIQGNYVQKSSGSLEVAAYGWAVEDEATLKVSNKVTLDGTLRLFSSEEYPVRVGTRTPLVSIANESDLTGRFKTILGTVPDYRQVLCEGCEERYPSLRDDAFFAVHYNAPESVIESLVVEAPRLIGDTSQPRLTEKGVLRAGAAKNLVLIAPGSAADADNHGAEDAPRVIDCNGNEISTLHSSERTSSWTYDLARAIHSKIDTSSTDIVTLDWSEFSTGHPSDRVNGTGDWRPWTAANQAISIGESLSAWFSEIGIGGYDNVHLISFSAGSWLVDALADSMKAAQAAGRVHLTLLDAFDSTRGDFAWGAGIGSTELGDDQSTHMRWGSTETVVLGESADYFEHYLDSRKMRFLLVEIRDEQWLSPPVPAVFFTDGTLQHAINFDITRLDHAAYSSCFPIGQVADDEHPYRLDSHAWPRHYYLDTVINAEDARVPERGFANSWEYRRHHGLLQHDIEYTRGCLIELPASHRSCPDSVQGDLLTRERSKVTGEGEVELASSSGGIMDVRTASNVQIASSFVSTQPINSLNVAFEFLDGSLGGLEILIDGESVLSLSRSLVNELDPNGHFDFRRIPLNRVLARGEHHVELRLAAEASSPARLAVQQLSANTYAIDSVLHNAAQPFDVNGDSDISPVDVLIIINALNGHRLSDLANGQSLLSPNEVGGYLDTNGDGAVTPIDALLIINWLNRRASVSAEAESSPPDVRVITRQENGEMPTIGLGILELSLDAPQFIHPSEYSSLGHFSADSASNSVDTSAMIVATSQITAASSVLSKPLGDMDVDVADLADPLDADRCEWEELLTALASELWQERSAIA